MEAPARKRGFDIASLVDHSDDHSSKKKKFPYPSLIHSSNYSCLNNNNNDASIAPVSLRDLPLFSSGLKLEGLAAQLAEAHANSTVSPFTPSNDLSAVTLPRMSTGQISAFKKVDKSSAPPATGLPLVTTRGNTNAIVSPPLDQSLFSIPTSVNVRQSHLPLDPSTTVRASSSSSSSSSNGTSLNSGSSNGNSGNCNSKNQSVDGNSVNINNSNCIGKPLMAPSLLPFLPPSLAALSFPHTNWCAKCNASFRMTSDLVYHMRSHHKPFANSDPVKKKREEKLRCNICGESFRERHHLTRHLTSHQ